MIDREYVLRMGGTPVPKGSLKCIGTRGGRGHQLIEDNDKTEGWRTEVARNARRIPARADLGQPVGVEITSTIARPAGHYGTGRNADRVKPSAPAHPTARGTGDSDKLARLVLDALQDAEVVHDDAQVVEVISRKAYPEAHTPDAMGAAGVTIRVYPYEP